MNRGKNDNRRSNGREDGGSGRKRDDDNRKRGDRDESRARAPQQNRGGGGGGQDFSRNGNDQRGQQHGGSFGGPGVGRGANSFSGMAFSESQLMDDLPKKKFTGRCRLFVGNLPNEVKEAELKELFTPHGDIAECYLSGKGFAFLRLDTRAHAESAKEAIDGRVIHGRQVRVRFAVHGAALRVKELSPTVSNEMLYHAFSHFGEVERAIHIVDEKGRPTGEGIVEFERKPSCNEAITAIREKVFLLTASPKPLVIEILEPRDEDDGLAERMIPRTPGLAKEREMGPRFPVPNSFEFVYGMKWKELYEVEKQRKSQLDNELKEARRRLEQDMELAYQDYQAQMLREDLQRRQQELERLEAARRDRVVMRGGPMGMGGPPQGGPQGGYTPAFSNPQMGLGSMNGPPPGIPPFGQGPPPGMYGGGPPQGVPPPGGQQQQQQQQHGQPGPGGRSNMIEGVQRLLQIFKNDPNANPAGIMNRGGPQDQFRGPPPQQQGMYPGGGPQPFGDYPPEKKFRGH